MSDLVEEAPGHGYQQATFWLQPRHLSALDAEAKLRGVSRQQALELVLEGRGGAIEAVIERAAETWWTWEKRTLAERMSFAGRKVWLGRALDLYAAQKAGETGRSVGHHELSSVADVLIKRRLLPTSSEGRLSFDWRQVEAWAQAAAA